MFVLDVNLLVALHRADHTHHATAREWWQHTSTQRQQLHIPDLVWVGFLRVVTNRRVFEVPTDMPEAVNFMQALRRYPHVFTLPSSDLVLDAFEKICTQDQVYGNLVTDAWIAASAKCLGACVVSFDRDFLRFRDLKVCEPSSR